MDIQALLDRRAAAWADRDPAALAADYADDAVVSSPMFPRAEGRAAIQKTFESLFRIFPDFDIADWLGFYTPTGTPEPVIARLAEAARAGMRDPNAVKRLGELGMIPVGSSPAEFQAFWHDQRARLGAIIQAEGIRVE